MADPVVEGVRAVGSVRPRFKPGQRVVDAAGRVDLGALSHGCSLVAIYDVLSEARVADYLDAAARVQRVSGRSGYGQMKPRREVCYRTADATGAYVYSGVAHATVPYPAHVLALVPEFRTRISALLPPPANAYTRLSNGIDIVYSSEFPRGGSIAAHGDDEHADWGLVLIYSLGQTRWLRVRHRTHFRRGERRFAFLTTPGVPGATGTWINVELRHNSLVAMHGAAFQRDFTHQVDKLRKDEPVYARLSLNLRFGL